jgi:hypothetical protein
MDTIENEQQENARLRRELADLIEESQAQRVAKDHIAMAAIDFLKTRRFREGRSLRSALLCAGYRLEGAS